MKTITAVNITKRAIKQGLTNEQIKNLPQFQKLIRDHGYYVNDRQIDGLRKSIADAEEQVKC